MARLPGTDNRPGGSIWAQNCALAAETAASLSSETFPGVAERPSWACDGDGSAAPPPPPSLLEVLDLSPAEQTCPCAMPEAGAAAPRVDELQTCREALRAFLQQQQEDLENFVEEVWRHSGPCIARQPPDSACMGPRQRVAAGFGQWDSAGKDSAILRQQDPAEDVSAMGLAASSSNGTSGVHHELDDKGTDDEKASEKGNPEDRPKSPHSSDFGPFGGLGFKRKARLAESVTASATSSMLSPLSAKKIQDVEIDKTVLQRALHARQYEVFVMSFVVLNAIFTGLQVHFSAAAVSSEEGGAVESLWFDIAEAVFVVVFTLELGLRLLAFRLEFFVSRTEWSWNLLDVFIVAAMLSEAVIAPLVSEGSSAFSQIALLRVLRVLRIVKILRIIRVLRFFSELRMLLSCIMNSFMSLSWTLAILLMMFYTFGLILTQGCVDFFNEEMSRYGSGQYEDLREYFGSLDASILSLFEAVADGISWGLLLSALEPLHWGYSMVFLAFVFFAVFAVLNIVTGVFVQGAMQRAQLDRESMISEAMEARDLYLAQMHQIFNEMDDDQSGEISKQEFIEAMEDDRMDAYFDANGLSVEDVDTLFVLLDRDNTGSIDIEEFLNGCLKLKGEAKGMDLAVVQFQAKWLMYYVGNIATRLSQCSALSDGFKGWKPMTPSSHLWKDAIREKPFARSSSMASLAGPRRLSKLSITSVDRRLETSS